jgi:hypothetical protein
MIFDWIFNTFFLYSEEEEEEEKRMGQRTDNCKSRHKYHDMHSGTLHSVHSKFLSKKEKKERKMHEKSILGAVR